MIFFTDLDGTLIRSAAKKHAGDIVVEYKDSMEITCISSKSAEILAKLDNVIPVTSRSIEQYKRIDIPGLKPKYALVDNGGNLLIDGVPDKSWAEWSGCIAEKHREEFSICRKLLENDPDRSFEVRLVDGLFLFTKSNSSENTLKRLSEAVAGLDLYSTGVKVYAIPKEFDKGAAVQRLINVLGRRGEEIVCAGDSVMDISMLKCADIALYPDDIGLELNSFSCSREGLCDFVVEKILEITGGTYGREN